MTVPLLVLVDCVLPLATKSLMLEFYVAHPNSIRMLLSEVSNGPSLPPYS